MVFIFGAVTLLSKSQIRNQIPNILFNTILVASGSDNENENLQIHGS